MARTVATSKANKIVVTFHLPDVTANGLFTCPSK